MRIKKVVIKNFRSFDQAGVDIALPDEKLPLSLVGQNSSGKSNFVDAVLFGMGYRQVYDDTFTPDDFHLKDENRSIVIEIHIDDPLYSSDAFNRVKPMPVLRLVAGREGGVGEVTHNCCDGDGKPIFNPRALSRGKKELSANERAVLNEALKGGAESVRKWRNKIPIHYIDCAAIEKELRAGRFTLLGKVVSSIKKEFEAKDSTVCKAEGVPERHVGMPRLDVFTSAMKYLETHVLPTAGYKTFVSTVQTVVKKQLDIEGDGFAVNFGQPSADFFFDNLAFFVTDNPKKPRLPITCMGSGFVSLFVVALLRAIVKESDGNRIFIFEEPETFQHEHFQEYFYNVLCEIAANNQVIYSTHSKKFVNIFRPASIFHFTKQDTLGTRICCENTQDVELPEEIEGFSVKNPDDFGRYLRTLEPNIGNIAFASKVLIVEGPHDVLAYRTVIERTVNLGLNNIAIVAAWGKDTIVTLVQLCKKWKIPFFAIHDWDIGSDTVATLADPKTCPVYAKLSAKDKGQFTKNWRILKEAGDGRVHHNRPHLEGVLGIAAADKCAASVFGKVNGKTTADIVNEFPLLFPPALAAFMGIKDKCFASSAEQPVQNDKPMGPQPSVSPISS